MALDAGSIVSSMVLKLDSWSSSVAKVKNDQDAFKKGTAKSNQALQNMGERLTRVGAQLSVVSAGFIAVGTVAVKAANAINKSMAGVATLLDHPRGQIQDMKKDVQNLSIQYGKSTKDMSDGLFQVISAFGQTAESMGILNVAAKAGTAGMTTTKEAINLITVITKSYNDETEKGAQKAADLAFMTNKLGVTTFPELAASMGRVVPLAAQLGVKQEELFAGFASLTGVTGNTNEVSTQFAAILRAMIKPTEDMQKAIKKLGFSNVESMIQTLGFQGAMEKLQGTTDGTIAGFAKLFGRAEAIGAGLAITGSQAKKFKTSLEKMGVSVKSSDKAYKNFTEGIGKTNFKFEQAKQIFSVLTQQLGDGLAPALVDILTVIKPVIGLAGLFFRGFSSLPGPIKTITVAIIAITVAIPPFTMALGFMTTMIAKIPLVTAPATAAIAKMMGVIGLAIIASQLLNEAIKGLGKSYDKAMGEIVRSNRKGQNSIKTMRDFMAQASPEMVEKINKIRKANFEAGRDWGVVSEGMINSLRKRSTEFKKWENSVRESNKAVKTSNAEVVQSSISLAEVEENIRLADLANLTLMKEEENLINMEARQLEKDMEAEFEEEQKQGAILFNQFFGQMQKERIKLQKKGVEKSIALEEHRYQEHVNRINATVKDELDKETILTEIKVNHLAKIKKLEEEKAKEDEARNKKVIDSWTNRTMTAVNTLTNVLGSFYQFKINNLETERNKQKKWIEENIFDETEKTAALEELENDFATKKEAIEKKAAATRKAAAIAGIIADTASNIVSVFPNFVLMGIAAAVGAANLAVAASAPALAEGGIAVGEQQVTVGDNTSGVEAIVPLEKAGQFGFGGGDDEGGKTININIETLDPRRMTDIFQEDILPQIQDAFDTENIRVNPSIVREA